MPRSGLSGLCIPENLQRRTAYSDVYRAMITLGGRTQYYDIEHIALPFGEDRERILRDRYGLSGPALRHFYDSFRTSFGRGLEIAESIRADGTNGVRDAMVQYVHEEETEREDGGRDLYLLTLPMTRLLDSDAFRGGRISAGMLARLGIRLSGTIRRLSETGCHLGVLDLDSVCLARAENGRNMAVITSLLYARKAGSPFPYLPVLPFNAPETIRAGREPTEASDIASLALLFTAILNETYGQSVPDTETLPAFIPEPAAAALAEARAEKCSAKEFQRIMAELKQTVPDADEHLLHIRRETDIPSPSDESFSGTDPDRRDASLLLEEELCDFRLAGEMFPPAERRSGTPFLRRLFSVLYSGRSPDRAAEDTAETGGGSVHAGPEEVLRMPDSTQARAMQKAYGYGSGTCEGCCNLRTSSFRHGLICAAYGDEDSSRCEWDPASGACGLYGQAFEHLRPAHRTWLATYGPKKDPADIPEEEQMSLF